MAPILLPNCIVTLHLVRVLNRLCTLQEIGGMK